MTETTATQLVARKMTVMVSFVADGQNLKKNTRGWHVQFAGEQQSHQSAAAHKTVTRGWHVHFAGEQQSHQSAARETHGAGMYSLSMT